MKLNLAPTWCSVVSFICYIILWFRGLQHAARICKWGLPSLLEAHENTLRFDVTNMCILYGVESGLALFGGQSTLAGWRRIDFLLHHLPYAIVVGGATWWGVPIYKAYAHTLPLTLLTSANEAITIGYTFGVPRKLDRPNRLYLLCLMICLIAVELRESTLALFDRPEEEIERGLRIVAVLQLGAPLYHAFGVVPLCWKRVVNANAAARAGSFEDESETGIKEKKSV